MWVQEAVSAALHAGCDADCGHDYQQGIPPMVANGTIDMQLVDKAVVRVLTNRMMLGELEVYSENQRDSFGKSPQGCDGLSSSSIFGPATIAAFGTGWHAEEPLAESDAGGAAPAARCAGAARSAGGGGAAAQPRRGRQAAAARGGCGAEERRGGRALRGQRLRLHRRLCDPLPPASLSTDSLCGLEPAG